MRSRRRWKATFINRLIARDEVEGEKRFFAIVAARREVSRRDDLADMGRSVLRPYEEQVTDGD
jgi:hypothetical protein